MDDLKNNIKPLLSFQIEQKANENGFKMSCDDLTGNLLRSLVSTKPSGHVLELGTGVGYSTCWILDGMDKDSTLISIESEEQYARIAEQVLGHDNRLKIIISDGGDFINDNLGKKYDLIFADTWPGKFYLLDEALGMLNKTGIFIIDDLNRQDNWPEGHELKVEELINKLDQRKDLLKLKMNWSTGIIIITKANVS